MGVEVVMARAAPARGRLNHFEGFLPKNLAAAVAAAPATPIPAAEAAIAPIAIIATIIATPISIPSVREIPPLPCPCPCCRVCRPCLYPSSHPLQYSLCLSAFGQSTAAPAAPAFLPALRPSS